MTSTGLIQEKVKEVKQSSKTVVFYFLPWLVSKAWQKMTNGTGTVKSALKFLVSVILYIPNSIISLAITWHKFYCKSLNEDPWILKLVITLLAVFATIMLSVTGVALSMFYYSWTPSILNIVIVTLKIQLAYLVFTLLCIAYKVFKKEQQDMLNRLTDE